MREVIGEQRNGERAQSVAQQAERLTDKVLPKGSRCKNARRFHNLDHRPRRITRPRLRRQGARGRTLAQVTPDQRSGDGDEGERDDDQQLGRLEL